MHNFRANYDKILEVLKSLDLESENFLFQIRKPRLSDLEIVALNLTSEYMSIDSEYQLFRILPSDIKSLIERSVYNRRKRRLFIHMERIRKLLAEKFNGSEKKKLTRIIEEEKDSNEMLLYNKVATEFGIDLLEAKEIVLTFIKKI